MALADTVRAHNDGQYKSHDTFRRNFRRIHGWADYDHARLRDYHSVVGSIDVKGLV